MRSMFSVAALLALLAAPSLSSAQDDEAEATKMAREHYKAGLDAYKAGNYEVAIKELKKAYLIKRLPPLLINIGATYRKMGDHDLALHFYRKYLDEAPAEARDRGEVENTIREVEAEKAGKSAAPPTTSKEPEEEAPRPRKSSMPSEFTHNPVDAAPPDTPLDVRVSMPVMKGVKVWLNYRVAGEADYQAVLMKRRGNEKVGRIPADAMQGKAIQYYIEAKDPGGAVVKSSGSDTSPNIVMIDPSARAQVVASYEERGSHEARGREPSLDDEKPPGRPNRDEEEAPLMGGGKPKKDRGPSNRTAMFWAGLGVAIVGVAGIGVGAGMGILAKQQSDAVTADAAAMPPYEFKDPNAPNGKDDAKFESDGKLFNTIAIVGFAAGGALAAAGIALMVVDVVKGKPAGKKRRPAAPRDEEMSWHLAPVAGPTQVGLGGGFSF